MSSDFTKILVKDDRMECVDNIKYAVIKGGQNVTPSQFNAISTSNNQLVFNIQVPSEQTLIDRRVLLQTDLTLVVTSQQATWSASGASQAIAASANGCGYGTVSGLCAYPLHSMMTVASATINNNTVSINMKDVLPAIIRMLDKKELGAFNGTTVTATDYYLDNGSNLFSGLLSQPILDTDYVGRGSLYLKAYDATQAGNITTETFTWHISEPLMLSPFIYCNPKSNGQAFYGIQNMNIVLNIGGDLSRVFRGCSGVNGLTKGTATSAPGVVYPSPAGIFVAGTSPASTSLPYILTVAPGGTTSMFSNTALLFTFLTAHPSDLYPARNIVPYYELPRYITAASCGQAFPTLVADEGNLWYQGIDTTQGTQFTSQTLQLNQIPDKLLVYIRKANQTYGDTDSYLPITHISIDFNNNSGLLSAARSEDLYRMSKDNGSNQSWNEWVGWQNSSINSTLTTTGNMYLPFTAATGTGLVFSTVATCGGVLVLEFGKDIQLIEDFFAPGSLGNFNIRLNVWYNNNNQSIAGSGPSPTPIEMVMITMNSGVFVCERGTSSTYTGILTRADVLEASEQDAYSRSDVKRMVGGGFLDMLKSGVSKLAPLSKAIAPHAAHHAMGKGSHEGMGQSGGGGSGGRLHGRYI